MNLEQRIMDDLKAAMKARNALELETLRSIKSKMKYFQIDQKRENLSEEDILGVIQKLVKQSKDAIADFQKGNREDLVAKEEGEMEILKKYLPESLSKADLSELIKTVIAETGAEGKKDFGKVMKAVIQKVKGRADGKEVSTIVGELLGG